MSRPSLRSIAEAAGVSPASVSNAYNRPDRLSASVRERILSVAEELGYAGPNPAARSLRTRRVGAVGVLLTTPVSYALSDPYCAELLRGVGEITDRTGTGLVLIPVTSLPADGDIGVDGVRQAVIDGAIADGLDADHPAARVLAARGIPLAYSTDSETGRCVIVDDLAAGRAIGEHLAERGHRRIAVVLGSSAQSGTLTRTVDPDLLYAYSRRRLTGIGEGLGPDAELDIIVVGGNSTEAGRQAAEAILVGEARPTAIAADSDVLAAGVTRAIHDRGLEVGRDLAVTGFDDLPIAAELGLTTVRQPIRQKGRLLARSLLDPSFTERRTVLEAVLVPRDSTSRPAATPGQRTRPVPPTMPDDQQQSGEWDLGTLDLESYLHRIRYEAEPAPDASTLRLLHRGHVATIPFENLDVILARGVSVALSDIQTKIVYRRRGGYCYEQNLLFAAALERIGFRVHRLLARTGDPLDHPRPHSHLVLVIEAGGRRWLADVGFGSGLLEPVPLVDGPAIRQQDWTFRVQQGSDGAWRLRELRRQGWETLYTFTEEPQFQVDMEMANHNTSTHPGSPFVQRPVVVRKTGSVVRQLIGRDLITTEPDSEHREDDVSDERYRDLLRNTFDLRLPADDESALLATLPIEGALR